MTEHATAERVRALICDTRFTMFGTLIVFEARTDREGAQVRGCFWAPDPRTGKACEHFTRRWLISPHATDSEIVQTLFKICLTAVEHEAREGFSFKGQSVFGPHFDVHALADLSARGGLDAREHAA